MANTNLTSAKKAKNDEFYTQLTDIENELKYYKDHFVGKVVYCNCDDARESNFFRFFQKKFKAYGLKKLITTSYNENGHGSVLVYEGDLNGNRIFDEDDIKVSELKGSGDFRSEECVEFLKEADIVVTNPPFSLFRDYIAQLVEYGKKFLVIGNQNAITYKEIFPLIKENKLWLGTQNVKTFVVPISEVENPKIQFEKNGKIYQKFGSICWFTNMEHFRRCEPLTLWKHYTSEEFPKYDNYNAIEVSKVTDIPLDYDGIMGVPITFLYKYDPSQFEIVGDACNGSDSIYDLFKPKINGKFVYKRILIKKLR